MLSVIIVDDEPPARRGMTLLLEAHADIKILGEAECVVSAKELLKTCSPDLVFLDVEMPQVEGFSLHEFLEKKTRIIFVTAYAEYAAKAFDVEALDYLLKPVRAERLEEALNRARRFFLKEDSQQDSMILKDQKEEIVVRFVDILALKAEGDYTRFLIRGRSELLLAHTLGSYQQDLPEPEFLRVNRSLIVNLKHVDSLKVDTRDSSFLHLKGLKDPILLKRVGTRTLRAALKERL